MIKDTFKRVLTPINKEGYTIIICAAVATFFLSLFSDALGWLGFIFTIFCLYFFRDPKRIIPDAKNLIVSPADGIVDAISNASPPKELGFDSKKKFTRISIFLNVFNVHVQRIPIGGKITKVHYREGKFVNVAVDKYSQDNERQACVVQTENGLEIPFVQIAGLIARRIVCNLLKGQIVKTGENYGIIKFGSRVDIYLPEGIKPKVKIGQTMLGGESIIAEVSGNVVKRETPKKKIIRKIKK